MLAPTEPVTPLSSIGPPDAGLVKFMAAPKRGKLTPSSSPGPQNFVTSATSEACPEIPAESPGATAFPEPLLLNTEILGSLRSTTIPSDASTPRVLLGVAALIPMLNATPGCAGLFGGLALVDDGGGVTAAADGGC